MKSDLSGKQILGFKYFDRVYKTWLCESFLRKYTTKTMYIVIDQLIYVLKLFIIQFYHSFCTVNSHNGPTKLNFIICSEFKSKVLSLKYCFSKKFINRL